MKTLLILAASSLVSCSLPSSDQARIESNLAKDGEAALVAGLATGTWQGAALGAGAQVVRNHTAAKQPVGKITP